MGIVEFLEARIAEDEAVAKAASSSTQGDEWESGNERRDSAMIYVRKPGGFDWVGSAREAVFTAQISNQSNWRAQPPHIARHDPARILREVAAKRAIIKAYVDADIKAHDTYNFHEDILNGESNGLETAVEALAICWSDHPDFSEGWRP